MLLSIRDLAVRHGVTLQVISEDAVYKMSSWPCIGLRRKTEMGLDLGQKLKSSIM